jgi:hypothetical protein
MHISVHEDFKKPLFAGMIVIPTPFVGIKWLVVQLSNCRPNKETGDNN